MKLNRRRAAALLLAPWLPVGARADHKPEHNPPGQQTPTPTAPPTATPVPTETPVPTGTPVPTATAPPTETPPPTATVPPTETPTPGPPTATPTATATPAPTVPPAGWVDLGQDPLIAAEETAVARTIQELCPYDGKVFLGYGEYEAANTNSGDLRYWQGGAFSTLATIHTEAILRLRVLDGVLYAVGADVSLGSVGDNLIRYDGATVLVQSGGSVDAAHLFDAQKWAVDGALYLAGQAYNGGAHDAAVYRSTDGGLTWGRTGVVDAGSYRCYSVVAAGGKLWTQPWNWSGQVPRTTAYSSTNGTTWTGTSVDLVPRPQGFVWKPYEVAGLACYLNRPGVSHGAYMDGAPNYLTVFDGATASERTGIGQVYDHFLAGGTLYVLTQAGTILATTDLGTFATVRSDVPAGARSLCVDGAALYVGTTDSHLHAWVPA